MNKAVKAKPPKRAKNGGLYRKQARFAWAVMSVGLAGVCLFHIYPLILSVGKAFTKGVTHKTFVGLDNFRALLGNQAFRLAAGNTLRFFAVSLPLVITLPLLLALSVSKMKRGAAFFSRSIILPIAIPTVSLGVLCDILFAFDGVANGVLGVFGIDPVDFLQSEAAFVYLVGLYVFRYAGYNFLLFLAGLSGIRREYHESARVDGAGAMTLFRKITLPLLSPTTVLVLIMSLINGFKVFREAYLIGGNYPHSSIYLLQHFMNNQFAKLDYHTLSCVSVIIFSVVSVLMVGLVFVQSRVQVEG